MFRVSQAEQDLAAIEEHARRARGGSPGAINAAAVGIAALIAGVGVLALQSLAEHNGHNGTRADTMSIVWCVFVSVMLLNTLLKKS